MPEGSTPGRLTLVPTPLGNLGDLTHRAVEALRMADLVACEDTRRTGRLLSHLGLERPLLRFDDHAPESSVHRLREALEAGKRVAYCSDAGMPGINDPGFELARMARSIGADVEVLPGPSAVTLAVVASGLPTHAFAFLGYVPARQEPRRNFLRALAGREETTVLFVSPHQIADVLEDLVELMPDREMALGRELTKLHETWYRGRAEEIRRALGSEQRGEMVLVLAGAAAKRTLAPGVSALEGDEELPAWAEAFLRAAREGGMTLREAVKPLARHLGRSPSELYRLATRMSE